MAVNVTDRFQVFAPQTRANPQAVYEKIRQEEPVYRAIGPVTGNTFWFFTRYDDCVAVLKDQRFGKEFRKRLPPEIVKQYGDEPLEFQVINRNMLFVDPPDHTRLRALVHKAFTPRMVDNLTPRIQQIANQLLDQMEGQREADLIASFGFPLPITVIAELLGVPLADRDKFRAWTKAIVIGSDFEAGSVAALEFTMYMHQLIEERQANPQDDLISALGAVEEEGERLDRTELLGMIFLLLVAGHETTVNLVGNGTLALLQHPDQLEKLKANPSLIKSAVEEMLRFNGPVETTTTRWAFEDVEVGGKVIRMGDIVLPALLAANRDPAYFPNPNQFDITREPNRHIAFGNGIHYCLGAPLARLEGAIAINTLLRRLPSLELAVNPEQLEWNDNILLHGMKALPVKF
jgi:cytochrome P450 PksS